ncbi:MAG: hypothetical protein II317_06185, partial [Clostridia bacterium]|nr:hypothetical protein [Clostridia bacterium]
MSIVKEQEVKCLHCGETNKIKIWNSLNTNENPEAKECLLKGTLFNYKCKNCGEESTYCYKMLYHDMDKHIMIYYAPTFQDREEAKKLLKKIDEIGITTFRIVSDINSLIEKIIIFDNGMDDTIIEAIKEMDIQQLLIQFPDFNIKEVLFYTEDERFFLSIKGEQWLRTEIEIEYYNRVKKFLKNTLKSSDFNNVVIDSEWAVKAILKANSAIKEENTLHLEKRENKYINDKANDIYICENCGEKNPEDSEYCQYCGKKFEVLEIKKNYNDIVDKGFAYLELKQWKKAKELFDLGIINDEDKAKAYIGRLLSKLKLTEIEYLSKTNKELTKFYDFKMALKYADKDYKEILKKIILCTEQNKKLKDIKQTKMMKILAVCIACIACLMVLTCVVFIPCGRYIYYKKMLSIGNIGIASDSYTNSESFEFDKLTKDLFYNHGILLIKEKKYKKAEICFETSKNHKKSEDYYNYCRGQNLLAEGNLQSYNYFVKCKGFLDSDN